MAFSLPSQLTEHRSSRDSVGLGPEFQKFTRRVLLPFCGLIALTLIALFASELWSAREADRLAAKASQELAQTGFQLALQQLGSNASATATWDDAVMHMHFRHDQDWAIENIGDWANDTLHFEMTFIIDPQGLTRFAMVDGKTTTVPIRSFLGEGLDPLLHEVREAPLGEAETGVVRADGHVAMVGAAAIHPHTEKSPPISGGYSILVYADLLDASAVEDLRRAYLLDGLALVPELPKRAKGILPLLPADGPPIAYLVWSPDRPGARLLAVVLPLFCALVIAITVLATFILFHARRAAIALSGSRQMALTDSLTGLPNRVLFEDRLQQALRGLDRKGGVVAVLCLDLDGFKRVNDLYGHASGDELLHEVARLLRAALRTPDTLARVGGDEFVVVQTGPDRLAAEELANRLLEALSDPIILQGIRMPIGASIGIAFADTPGEAGSHLMRLADLALYEAKRAGGNQYRVSQSFQNCLREDEIGLFHGNLPGPTLRRQ